MSDEALAKAREFIQNIDDALREAGHPSAVAVPGTDGFEGVSHVECVRALAGERDGLRKEVKRLRGDGGSTFDTTELNEHPEAVIRWLRHDANILDMNPNPARPCVAKRLRDYACRIEVTFEKLTILEISSYADSVQGEAAWRGRAEVAELALTKARAKIEGLQKHVSVVDFIARRTLERTGHASDVPTPATNCMGALEADIERERARVRKLQRQVTTWRETLTRIADSRSGRIAPIPPERAEGDGFISPRQIAAEALSAGEPDTDEVSRLRGQVAAMREVLQEIKKITFPDESSNVYHETAYHLAANAVDNKFGEPEAEVIAAAVV